MTAFFIESRKDRRIQERVHDPYQQARKSVEPGVCPVCNAVFKGGHWQWLESPPADGHKEICQACQRVRDKFPAGLVTLRGDLVRTHRTELLNLVRNQEQRARALHPLHRIIELEERGDEVSVSTTDLHLPKRIGAALHRAYKGRLVLEYEKAGCFVRVNWTSNL